MKNDTLIKAGTLGLIAVFIIFSISTFAIAEKDEKAAKISYNSWYYYLGKGVEEENDGFSTGTSIKTKSPKEKKPKDKPAEDPVPAPDEPDPGSTDPDPNEPGSGNVGTMGVTPPLFMIDDYNDSNENSNSLGFWTGGNGPGLVSFREVQLYEWVDTDNKVKEVTYDCSNPGDYAWYTSNVWDDVTPLNASDFDYISFRVKRESGNELCYLKIASGNPTAIETFPLSMSVYFKDTNEWQIVNVPISDFTGFLDKNTVKGIVFFFDNGLAAKAGTLKIDNLQFTEYGYGYGKPESTGRVGIRRDTGELYLDGQPFTVKGVGYQPTPIGAGPPSPENPFIYDDDPNIYERDFHLLEEIGCNTIRTWSLPPSPWPINPGVAYTNLMDKAEEHGLKVIASFWMDQYADYVNDPSVHEKAKQGFIEFVNAYKDKDALLVWAIGNENNIHMRPNVPEPTEEDYILLNKTYYTLCNELAEIAHSIEGDSYHPVMIVNGGLHYIGIWEMGAEDPQLNYIDVWGNNAYYKDFNNIDWYGVNKSFFELYKEKSSKPLIITEYGADAYRTESVDPIVGQEDGASQQAQAFWVGRNTYDILYAPVFCAGGCVMAYSDGWWKDPAGTPLDHDPGSAAPWPGRLPDGYANEEYWGIVQIALDGTWNAPDGLDDVKPRPVYNKLKTLFNVTRILSPGESIQTAINAASPGDIILLKPGTYTLNSRLNITKNITLAGISPNQTIIELGNYHIFIKDPRFYSYNEYYYRLFENLNDVIIDGITITGYRGSSREGAIRNYSAKLTLKNCKVIDNRGIKVGAIYSCWKSELYLENTLIANNRNPAATSVLPYGFRQGVTVYCGTIYLSGYAGIYADNSTIADNINDSQSFIIQGRLDYDGTDGDVTINVKYGAIHRDYLNYMYIKNSIMWGNGNNAEDFSHRDHRQFDVEITYCDLESTSVYMAREPINPTQYYVPPLRDYDNVIHVDPMFDSNYIPQPNPPDPRLDDMGTHF